MLIGWRMGTRRAREDVIDFVFSSFSFRCRFGRWRATSPSTVWRSILYVGVWLGVRTGKRRTSTEESTPQGNQRKTWQSLGKWRYLKLRKCMKRKKREKLRAIRAITTTGLAPGANGASRAPPTPKNKNKLKKNFKAPADAPNCPAPWFFGATWPFLPT